MSRRLEGSSGNDEIQTPDYLYQNLDNSFTFTLDAFASHENAKTDTYCTKDGIWQRCTVVECAYPAHIIDPTDGFTTSWAGDVVFANPPYSMLMKAAAKFESEVDNARWIAMLVKWDHSTKWAQRLMECAIIVSLPKRVKYVHPDPPPGWGGASFPSALAFPRKDWLKDD